MQEKVELTTSHRGDMNIVVVGPVEQGKKTISGRLLADSGSLPAGMLESVSKTCRHHGKTFKYSLLLDALKETQTEALSTGLTRYSFNTARRNYHILFATDHIDLLKNIITGVVRAEAALLIIDASQGIQENTRRHANILSFLGIKQVAVLINKMDLVGYREEIFQKIKKECLVFLGSIDIEPSGVVPVSGTRGDNIAAYSDQMFWFTHKTVLEVLDLFDEDIPLIYRPFRMPVQDIYNFTCGLDNRPVIAGTVESGTLNAGEDLIFFPSGKTGRVKTIEAFNIPGQEQVAARSATGFTIFDQISVARGEVATIASQPKPEVSTRIKTNIFWLGNEPLAKGRNYLLKIGTTKVKATVEKVNRVIDAFTLAVVEKESLDMHEAGECLLSLEKDIAFDTPDLLVQTSRFVLMDKHEICGGGLVLEGLPDAYQPTREKVFLRNKSWERSHITKKDRVERFNQQPTFILITGPKEIYNKQLAKALEKMLFAEGKLVFFLSMDNLLYGVNADINPATSENKNEHFRRLAEVANIMLDAGVIFIVSMTNLTRENQQQLKLACSHTSMTTVWAGKEVASGLDFDLHIPTVQSEDNTLTRIKEYLQKKGVIFKPWSVNK